MLNVYNGFSDLPNRKKFPKPEQSVQKEILAYHMYNSHLILMTSPIFKKEKGGEIPGAIHNN